MLRPVWPCAFFWFLLVFVFSSVSILETYRMEIFGKGIFLVDVVVNLALVLGWVFGLLVFFCVFVHRQLNPSVDRLFQGYGVVKKATVAALLFLGNILVYYFSEKSVACMLTFFFLACFWFCVLCCLQPCTDFGVLDFLLSASLNVALNLCGVRIHTWLVSMACILVILLRYFLDPMSPPEEAVSSNSQVQLQDGSNRRPDV